MAFPDRVLPPQPSSRLTLVSGTRAAIPLLGYTIVAFECCVHPLFQKSTEPPRCVLFPCMRSRPIELRTSVGVLNLPIYVPALAFILDISYDMNRELLGDLLTGSLLEQFSGQGVANIFAGMLGTVPSIFQYSYSVNVTRIEGGRFELTLISIFTAALFLCAGLFLLYVPTILASALVMFLGIELFLEAIWETSKTLAWMEYVIVLATLGTCTFLGFAEGFGVEIGAAAVVYLTYGSSIRFIARAGNAVERVERVAAVEDERSGPCRGSHGGPPAPAQPHAFFNHTRLLRRNNLLPSTDLKTYDDVDFLQQINACARVLSGYICALRVHPVPGACPPDIPVSVHFFIPDLTHGHRIETAAARVFLHCVREFQTQGTAYLSCAASV
ncbi:hypothetical protein B0H14DRAFT_3576160 [Mycena olivaceomarginata]|nr:hypothetical protein B0H14DRAFT_3576160 [Mycena olivaceomarginata]